MMRRLPRLAVVLLALSCSACATLSTAQRERVNEIVAASRPARLDCDAADRCAQASSLHALGARAMAESTPKAPRHYALILDYGQDALLARINLIRSAREAIDLQTYIFDEDDAGHLVLDELLAAARRGVKVRVLIDQLSAFRDIDTLAALAAVHANFALRVYNPVFNRGRINYLQYGLATACCFRRLNQRMHSKLLLIDGRIGITGGRNYQDDYYDWNPEYNFRDRDVLVAGPIADEMAANFAMFWEHRRSVPVEQLNDVARRLLRDEIPPRHHPKFARPQRAAAMVQAAGDDALVQKRLVDAALPVGAVEFIADPPQKHRRNRDGAAAAARSSPELRTLIESAQREVLIQTPYLVLSEPAQTLFRDLQRDKPAPAVIISTNSLAATDAFIVYALSHKYKRRYLRDFKFQIYEFKPFPADAPIDLAATGAELPILGLPVQGTNNGDPPRAAVPQGSRAPRIDRSSVVGRAQQRRVDRVLRREDRAIRYFGSGANAPVPLKRAGVRIGLHAKSLVVDERIGVIGTHNFDPRGDRYNTESAVVIEDAAFAQQLAQSIRRDIAPENAWVIAPRDKPPVFSGLEYSLSKVSEHLPLFDLWPTRYATSYQFVPGPNCPLPLPPRHPQFRKCYRPVGDFPEVDLGLKGLTTRIFTAFGAGLAPIL